VEGYQLRGGAGGSQTGQTYTFQQGSRIKQCYNWLWLGNECCFSQLWGYWSTNTVFFVKRLCWLQATWHLRFSTIRRR
jgi:hypothetical protein